MIAGQSMAQMVLQTKGAIFALEKDVYMKIPHALCVVAWVVSACVTYLSAQTTPLNATLKTSSIKAAATENSEAKSDEKDEANSSPRERGRILQKRNPVASEYQILGELGTSPGADADGEGVDYRAFFPAAKMIGDDSSYSSIGYSLNFNNLSGKLKSGGDVAFRTTIGDERMWVFSGQFKSTSSDRQIEHYESVWQQLFALDSQGINSPVLQNDEPVYYLDRPRYSQDFIFTRNNISTFQVAKALTDNHYVYYKTSFQDYYDNFYRNRLELQLGSGDLGSSDSLEFQDENLVAGTFENARTRRFFGDTGNTRERQHHIIGGSYEGKVWSIDYSAYFHSWDLKTEWYNWNFNDFNLDFSYRIDDPNLPTFTVDSGQDLLDQSTARFSSLRIHNTSTKDEDFAWRADGETRLLFLDEDLWIQAGALHREKERQSGENRVVYSFNPDDPFYLSEVENDERPGKIIDEAFELQAGLDPAKGRQLLHSDSNKFLFNDFRSTVESAPQSYNAKEAVTSTYLLGVTKRGDWTIEFGGRYEQTETDTRGTVVVPQSVNDPNEGVPLGDIIDPNNGENIIIKDIFASNEYSNFLPSVEFNYALSDRSQIKASWYQLLMRPQYFDIVNYRRISVPTRNISEGNPSLAPTEIDKFRLAYIIETEGWGDISIEGYLVDVENFFYGAVSKEQILEDGIPTEYSVGRVENGESGEIRGFELQWQKPIENLPLFESGAISLAYTYSDSEATVATRPDEILRVPERSDHLLKASFRAKLGKFSSSLEFAYQDEALDDVGDITQRDEYREDVVSLSLNKRYKISDSLETYLSLYNLTDHRERSYEADPIRKQRNQYSSWFAIMGAKKTF